MFNLFKKQKKRIKPELLSPAGDWVMLRAVIEAGADSVYLGVKGLNMRESAGNFPVDELSEVVGFCHSKKVKAYLTLNTIVFDNELVRLERIIKKAKLAKIDGVICWDFSVISLLKKYKVPIILSTQSSISNTKALQFFKKQGVKRVILARECSLKQIKKIIKESNILVEVFVHGAMCVSISGRCFLSHDIFKKSANRGECLQPCRRKYVAKEIEEGHELEIGKDYIMSPKDLCCLPFIDELIKVGISCFKIEGRTRSPEYAKTVTECYRKAIDAVFAKQFSAGLIKVLMDKVKSVYHRKLSSGFYLGFPTGESFTDVYGSNATTRKQMVGKVINYFNKPRVVEIKLESLGLKLGDHVMIQGETTGIVETKIKQMVKNYKDVKKASKGESITIKLPQRARKNDKVFVIVPSMSK